MSTDRNARLTPAQLALKQATADAVRAAGGEVFVAREAGRSQGRISDYCSANTADFIPLGLIAPIEALGTGAPGWPHITRALARAQGLALGDGPAAGSDERLTDLGDWLARIVREFSDVTGQFAMANLAAACGAMAPAARARMAREVDQLDAALAGFRAALASDTGASDDSVVSIGPVGRRGADTS